MSLDCGDKGREKLKKVGGTESCLHLRGLLGKRFSFMETILDGGLHSGMELPLIRFMGPKLCSFFQLQWGHSN